MSKTNKFSPEVRERAVRLVLGHEHEPPLSLGTILKVSCLLIWAEVIF